MLTSTEKEVKRLKVILLALLTVDSKKWTIGRASVNYYREK
jgi:hypothetical protein